MSEIKVPKWIQNRLIDDEKVIANTNRCYATDRRLINRYTRYGWSSPEFLSLEYGKISDITYKKHIKGIISSILILFLISLIYILIVPDMLGHPYKIAGAWVRPFSGFLAFPEFAIFLLFMASFWIVMIILIWPFSYYQIKSPDFDRKHLRYWRIFVPGLLNRKEHRFIEIVKEKIRY